MRDIERYTENTRKHVPKGYKLKFDDIRYIADKDGFYEIITLAWDLGFESAYRAAKAGRLDFQK